MARTALLDVIQLGGLALQSEDCAIRAAVAHRGGHGGIVRMENERYHQFVIWRALLPFWEASIEKQGAIDLILSDSNDEHFFELKNWRTQSIPSVQRDIEKLQGKSNGYVIVTSGNPTGEKPLHTDENIEFLLAGLKHIQIDSQKVFRFETVDSKGDKFEYWIAGWRVVAAPI